MSTIIHDLMKINTEKDAEEYLEKVLNPTTRNEMGEVYTRVMGYDPLTHFDRKEIVELLNDFIADNPQYAEGEYKLDIDEIADMAVAYINEHRHDDQADAIISVMKIIAPIAAVSAFDSWYSEPVDGDDDEEYEECDDQDEENIFDDEEDE